MNHNEAAAIIMARAAALSARVSAMNAENQQRLANGYSVAYGEDAFLDAITEEQCDHNAVWSLIQQADD